MSVGDDIGKGLQGCAVVLVILGALLFAVGYWLGRVM